MNINEKNVNLQLTLEFVFFMSKLFLFFRNVSLPTCLPSYSPQRRSLARSLIDNEKFESFTIKLIFSAISREDCEGNRERKTNKVYYDWKHARSSENIFRIRFYRIATNASFVTQRRGRNLWVNLMGRNRFNLQAQERMENHHRWLLTLNARYQVVNFNVYAWTSLLRLEGWIINDINFYFAIKKVEMCHKPFKMERNSSQLWWEITFPAFFWTNDLDKRFTMSSEAENVRKAVLMKLPKESFVVFPHQPAPWAAHDTTNAL